MVTDTPSRFLGVTPPISTDSFSSDDAARTMSLIEYMDEQAPLESPEGEHMRQIVIGLLKRTANQWCYETAISLGASEALARETKCAIVPFGSYKLGGLIGPKSDMDLVCICPSILTVDAFFSRLVTKLHDLDSVSDVVPIPAAFTPIIKLKVNDIEIDLLFCRLATPRLPAEDIEANIGSNDRLLTGIDQRSARALNGPRVASALLDLIPNKDTFRPTLRAIKLWAERRQIYSNVLGYFGGVAWAICVARVCQLYPNYCPAQLLLKFFETMANWNWSETPIQLNRVEQKDEVEFAHFQVWTPASNRGLMPILTPAFPCQNATDPVTATTKRVILDECKRGIEILSKWAETEDDESILNQLFEPKNFGSENFYIFVGGKTKKIFNRIKGFVELKIRSLIVLLEKAVASSDPVELRPFPNFNDDTANSTEWPFSGVMRIGLFSRQSTVPDMRIALDKWMKQIAEWNERDEYLGQFEVEVKFSQPEQLDRDIVKKLRTE